MGHPCILLIKSIFLWILYLLCVIMSTELCRNNVSGIAVEGIFTTDVINSDHSLVYRQTAVKNYIDTF